VGKAKKSNTVDETIKAEEPTQKGMLSPKKPNIR
jgi:hypothetical protein